MKAAIREVNRDTFSINNLLLEHVCTFNIDRFSHVYLTFFAGLSVQNIAFTERYIELHLEALRTKEIELRFQETHFTI